MRVATDHRGDPGGRQTGHVVGHHDRGTAQEPVGRADHAADPDRHQVGQPALVREADHRDRVRATRRQLPTPQRPARHLPAQRLAHREPLHPRRRPPPQRGERLALRAGQHRMPSGGPEDSPITLHTHDCRVPLPQENWRADQPNRQKRFLCRAGPRVARTSCLTEWAVGTTPPGHAATHARLPARRRGSAPPGRQFRPRSPSAAAPPPPAPRRAREPPTRRCAHVDVHRMPQRLVWVEPLHPDSRAAAKRVYGVVTGRRCIPKDSPPEADHIHRLG